MRMWYAANMNARVPRFLFLHSLELVLAVGIVTLCAMPGHAATPATSGVFVPHSLTVHLQNHATTLLSDGTVLITGGVDHSGTVQSSAEIYDPATGITTVLSNTMNMPRDGHTATLLSDGSVLIAGGNTTGGSPVSSAELYSPSAQTFALVGSSMTVERALHSATLLEDGTVLLAGGLCGNSCTTGAGGNSVNGITFTAEIFDPTGASFTAVGNMRLAQQSHTATRLNDGTVLLAGGISNSGGGVAPTNGAELYRPSSQSFGGAGSMTNSRSSHTATLLNDGTVLITGGASGPFPIFTTNALPSAEIFIPSPRSFTQLSATMTTPRVAHAAALLQNGTVLIAGGQDDTLIGLSSAEIYDSVAKTFTATAASMDVARSQHTATALVDGTVLLVGGATAAADLVQLDLFDPTPGAFVPTGSMTEPRQFHTATMVQDGTARIFVAGGQNAVFGPLNSTEFYDGAGFDAGPALNVARSLHTATSFVNGSAKQILIAGGVTSAGGGFVTDTAEIYAPVAGGIGSAPVVTTTAMTNSPAGRFGHTATYLVPIPVTLPNGGILVVGGEDKNGIVQSTTDLFIPDGVSNGSFNISRTVSKTSSTAHNLKTARVYHTATTLCDGTVLVAGGRDPNGNYLNSVEIYDPTKDAFAAASGGKTGGMLTARAFHTATLLSDCSVLLAGGVNSKGVLSAAERYIPPATSGKTKTVGAFVAAPPMNSARDLHTATFLPDGTVLVTGGESGPAVVSDTGEIYNPFLQTFTPAVGTMLSARFGHTAVALNSGFVLLMGGRDATFAVTAGSELYDPPSGPQPGGAIVFATPQGKRAAANHLVKAGSVRITNMSNLFESVTGATLALSDPALFSSITLSGDGGSTTVTPSATIDVVFDPPIEVAPGDTLDLSFAGRLATHQRGHSSAQALTGLSITNSLGAASSLGLPTNLGSVTER
jgi:galactose oxidase-like protein